jgi:dihydroxyacetone kinase
MTRLVNRPADFADSAIAGFAAAQGERVLGVPGGVVRSTRSADRQVAIVMGGGSGHFPAFAGWVGVGFGHGAACGNIFSSPSETQVLSVAHAADNGGGILFVPINYAGDILHFTAAAEKLRAEGTDARMVAVTDDIASGSPEMRHTRRGIAGSFLVLKMVGAAAEFGYTLDDVERVAIAANEATRSFGVAFSGCTLPGNAEPLFTVPVGQMAVGLGIHGEPGISQSDLGSADDVADVLVDGLFAERAPEAGRPVALLVNGLGSTKYDELFVVFGRVRERIEQAGMRLVAPVVGEQVTSLDMAGVSISLAYLDDELEGLWLAAADTASFSRGVLASREFRAPPPSIEASVEIPAATPTSREVAARLLTAATAAQRVLVAEEVRLGELDAVAGDGDHGAGMVRGVTAAVAAATLALQNGAGAGTLLERAGAAWSDRGGGTSGALWGAGLEAAGRVIGDSVTPPPLVVRDAVRAFADAITDRGGAAKGDKTMVDAIGPFVSILENELASGSSLGDAWRRAVVEATSAAAGTADIAARRGRARIHGDRSIGTPDAGAVSFALIASSVPGS